MIDPKRQTKLRVLIDALDDYINQPIDFCEMLLDLDKDEIHKVWKCKEFMKIKALEAKRKLQAELDRSIKRSIEK